MTKYDDDNDRTNLAEENAEREDNTQVDDAGVPGQIVYPDAEVNAERAAAFAAGKEDSLYEDDPDGRRSTWQNPADNPGAVPGEEGVPGDESGEETEPEPFADPDEDRDDE